MEAIQFINVDPSTFQEGIISKVLEIMTKPKEEEVLLTQEEVAAFYRVSTKTIIKWQSEGKIKAYSIANERRYKKSELMDNLILMKSK